MTTDTHSDTAPIVHRAHRGRTVLGVALLLCAAAIAVIRFIGEEPVARNPESFLASLALGAVIAVPGTLTLIAARTERPSLLLPAAIVLTPLSLLSPVTLPLLIGVVLLAVAWVRTPSPGWSARTAASAATAVLGSIGAAAVLLVMTTTRSFTDGSSEYGTTGWIPWSSSVLALALVATAIFGATVLAPTKPRAGLN